jgi:hypothetical protein
MDCRLDSSRMIFCKSFLECIFLDIEYIVLIFKVKKSLYSRKVLIKSLSMSALILIGYNNSVIKDRNI